MKIGEVAERSGTPASAIRYYESIGVLPATPRASGQRAYGPGTLEALQAVRAAQGLGFNLQEIKVLLGSFRSGEDPSRECRDLARRKLRDLDRLAKNVERMRSILRHGLTCRCANLSGCYVGRSDRPSGGGRGHSGPTKGRL